MHLEGAAALVTGGASGLGAAAARRLAEMGAAVTVCDLDGGRGSALAAELGPQARFVACDVTDPDQVADAVAGAAGAPGLPLRVAVNCAGIADATRTVARNGQPHDPGRFARVIAINLTGTFHVLARAAATMAKNEPLVDGERGVIVNTASIAAFDGQIGQLAYAASKGGVASMTLPAARDLSNLGIRVVAIAPGLMDTPMLGLLPADARQALGDQIPFPRRLGYPEEFAAMVATIVENRYLNGATLRMDGALRMPPR